MKKLFLIISLLSLCVGCEKDEITSLEGTKWEHSYKLDDGSWGKTELIFTSATATYVKTNSLNINETFTGIYIYDPPNVVITNDSWTEFGDLPPTTFREPYLTHHIGTVKGRTMTIEIWKLDIVEVGDFYLVK